MIFLFLKALSCFQVLVAPPLFRIRPAWYQRELAQIASRFSSTFSTNLAHNLLLLPSFISQDLMPDCIHLTPVSGLHFVLHLFDQTETLLSLEPASSEIKLAHVQESVRHHGDRLSFLESRHGQLKKRVDLKAAKDSEFDDWVTNRNEEDWVTVLGLKRLGRMTPREWQTAARSQVRELFKYILHLHRVKLDFSVLYVGNPVRKRTTGGTVYNVRLNSVTASKTLRDLFSGFFRHENPVNLPPDLRGISLRNKVTIATRIRIEILRVLASNHMATNPGSFAKVHGFEPRPRLVIQPARGSSDPPRTFHFIEAVTMLPTAFSDDGLAQIFKVIGTHHEGELRSLFVVLDDDDRDRCLELASTFQRPTRFRSAPSGPSAAPSVPATSFGVVSGSGTGMDATSSLLHSIRSPPPPPPPRTSQPSRSRSRDRDRDVRVDPRSRRESASSSRERDRSARGEAKRRHESSSSSPEPRRSTRSKRTCRSPSSSSAASSSSSDRHSKKKKKKSKSKSNQKTSQKPSRKARVSSSCSDSDVTVIRKPSKK